MEIINIKAQTNNLTPSGRPILNMFDVTYSVNGKIGHWFVASRNKAEALECLTKANKADTVSIVPFIIDKDGEQAIVLNKEFRLPINDYIYSFCSGIVDPGETALESAKRELAEEIGATEENIIAITQLTGVTYNSEGMTDESAVLFEASIKKLSAQNLQDDEDIKTEIVKIKNLEEFVKNKKLSTKAGIYLPLMAREYKLCEQNTKLQQELANLKKELENISH